MPRYGEASSYGSTQDYQRPESPLPTIAAVGATGLGARSTALAIHPNTKAIENKAAARVTDAQTKLEQARDAKPKGWLTGRRNKATRVKQATDDLVSAQIRQMRAPERIAHMKTPKARLRRGGVGVASMAAGGAYLAYKGKERYGQAAEVGKSEDSRLALAMAGGGAAGGGAVLYGTGAGRKRLLGAGLVGAGSLAMGGAAFGHRIPKGRRRIPGTQPDPYVSFGASKPAKNVPGFNQRQSRALAQGNFERAVESTPKRKARELREAAQLKLNTEQERKLRAANPWMYED